jgi:hypothetical protein
LGSGWEAAGDSVDLRVGWLMLARTGVLKALNRSVVREFNPDRKETHWGKRKLKRDQ